jgi:aminoglycoside phosphotransferase (APT) family kinase protein
MPASDAPGRLVGAGRAADVYAIGAGKVLRRYRTSFDARPEAEMMRYLAHAGYPVPAVYDADGSDLVMEWLDGRDMLADISRRPWLARRHARTLADLHNRLHQIAAPRGWPQLAGARGMVLHLDLHPGNVMLTSRGPVVIDWTNARSGPAGADVAMAYLIMASSEAEDLPLMVRGAVSAFRGTFIRHFLLAARDDPAPYIAKVARHRMSDRNVRQSEADWLARRVAQAEAAADGSSPPT